MMNTIRAASRLAAAVALLGMVPVSMAADDETSAPEQGVSAASDATSSETAAEPPVKRRFVFQSQESMSFKQKIQIYNRSKDHAEQLYCREDRMTGSHRKRMRCVTNEVRQLEEDSARLFFESLPRGGR